MVGRISKRPLAIGGLLLLACAAPAAASPITYDITFGASDFAPSKYPDFVLGRFSVTLEPGVRSEGAADLDFVQLPLDSSLAYFYGPEKDELIVGGAAGGAAGLSGDDFILRIDSFDPGALATSTPLFFALEASSGGTTTTSFHGSVHVAQAAAMQVATTPIPAALPLFALALGGLGFAGWRRGRNRA